MWRSSTINLLFESNLTGSQYQQHYRSQGNGNFMPVVDYHRDKEPWKRVSLAVFPDQEPTEQPR
jgi:hypothetical protein